MFLVLYKTAQTAVQMFFCIVFFPQLYKNSTKGQNYAFYISTYTNLTNMDANMYKGFK